MVKGKYLVVGWVEVGGCTWSGRLKREGSQGGAAES